MPRHPLLLCVHVLCLWLLGLTGCSLSRIVPEHFQFVTVVEKTEPGAGGWRAACIHAHMVNMATQDSMVCKFGVEMPVETEEEGLISTPLAQRIAADCANHAADSVMGAATAATTPGLACQSFKSTFDKVLYQAVRGSQVTTICHKMTKPVRIGF
jgi:pyruvoyl-dependent arginine decarboxylase (PvlArgDC)